MTPLSSTLLIAALLAMVLLVVPAAAELNYTRTDDGKTLIANGSYWIKWDPIGNHTVGDQFFINGTTNLSAGTFFGYGFIAPIGECHSKICNSNSWGIVGNGMINSGQTPTSNAISIVINTTGLPSTQYFFGFWILSSVQSAEFDSFNRSFSPIPSVFLFLKKGDNISAPDTMIKPTTSPIPVICTVAAFLVSLCVFLLIQRNKKQRQLR